MPLIKEGRIAADLWVSVAEDEAVPAHRPAIVGLRRWQAETATLRARIAPLGIRLKNNDAVADIAGDLDRFELVALEFPKFTDGRAYSQARLLRERHGFPGEIRATGQVLRDQFQIMHRCGFDAFQVADAGAAEGWVQALQEIGVRYQEAADGSATVRELRHRAAHSLMWPQAEVTAAW